MEFIDLKAQYQSYKREIEARLHRVLEHGRFILGPEIQELESTLAGYVGVPQCITVSSGTASLEIALRALGIGPGDEVLTVPFTFISTAEVISLVGARPVFVDIEPETYNMDPEMAERAVTSRTKAIIAVDLFGQMADYPRLNALARRHGLPLIEDAAQSFGATQQGVRSCAAAAIASTSFFPAKPFGCYGDGGALFVREDSLAAKMRDIRNHGSQRRDDHPLLGTNGRFDTLQAAVLLAKWNHFAQELRQREAIAARYSEALHPFCQVPVVRQGNTHVYAQYTIELEHRNKVVERLRRAGIPAAIYYSKCLHLQPVFSSLGYAAGDFPRAEAASRRVLSLPMHPFLEEPTQARIIQALRQAIEPKP